jgi:hypothetical protein
MQNRNIIPRADREEKCGGRKRKVQSQELNYFLYLVISANQQKPLSISKGTFVIINCRDHDDQERDTSQPRQKTGQDKKRTIISKL